MVEREYEMGEHAGIPEMQVSGEHEVKWWHNPTRIVVILSVEAVTATAILLVLTWGILEQSRTNLEEIRQGQVEIIEQQCEIVRAFEAYTDLPVSSC